MEIDGETMETVTDFIFLGSKITGDGDCSHEIKRQLLLGRKAMTNLDSILKTETLLCWQRPYSQSYGFSSSHIWMWELNHKEGWVPKNWCFQTVVLEKTLRVPWTSKRSNQSILKEINPEYSLEGLMLATWCEELTYWKRPWCWKRLKARGEVGNRGWDGWMASPTQWTWVWASSRGWQWIGKPGVLQSMRSQRAGHDWMTELPDWGSHVKYYPYNREEQNQS